MSWNHWMQFYSLSQWICALRNFKRPQLGFLLSVSFLRHLLRMTHIFHSEGERWVNTLVKVLCSQLWCWSHHHPCQSLKRSLTLPFHKWKTDFPKKNVDLTTHMLPLHGYRVKDLIYHTCEGLHGLQVYTLVSTGFSVFLPHPKYMVGSAEIKCSVSANWWHLDMNWIHLK